MKFELPIKLKEFFIKEPEVTTGEGETSKIQEHFSQHEVKTWIDNLSGELGKSSSQRDKLKIGNALYVISSFVNGDKLSASIYSDWFRQTKDGGEYIGEAIYLNNFIESLISQNFLTGEHSERWPVPGGSGIVRFVFNFSNNKLKIINVDRYEDIEKLHKVGILCFINCTHLDFESSDEKENASEGNVFYVPESYIFGEEDVVGLSSVLGIEKAVELELAIAEVAKKQGYKIMASNSFDRNNPNAIGIDANLTLTMNQLEQDDHLSRLIDLEMPKRISLEQVLLEKGPIVAKKINEHGGGGVFLLETKEQKARFISWLLSINNIKSRLQIKKLINRVKKGDLTPLSSNSMESKWYFEKYVETPSNFNTSFRVLIDCFGKIHYGVLIRSAQEKRLKRMPDIKKIEGKKLSAMNFLKRANVGGISFDVLLNSPYSPLYLRARSIVSNVARGGVSITLKGEKIIGEINREVLESHNINPDFPMIPEELIKASKIIAVEARGDFPFVGVDFLLEKDGTFKYLETNFGPNVSPKRIGLSEKASVEDAQLELMKRVLTNIN